MGSSKHQCTSRATYIQFRISEIIDARKRNTEIKKSYLKAQILCSEKEKEIESKEEACHTIIFIQSLSVTSKFRIV